MEEKANKKVLVKEQKGLDLNNKTEPKMTEQLDLEAFDLEDLSLDNNNDDMPPILPQYNDGEDEYDLQKELEAKFDELFGPLDED